MSSNKKLRFAGIGCTHMGWKDISTIGKHEAVEMVAFCDVDSRHFSHVDKQWPGRPKFDDFRVMFDKMGSEIDAVNITVPDHSHAVIAQAAMERGLHVYCQKPLTHTVWEARQMAALANKTGVTTRMGNQIHSEFQYRCAKLLIQEEKKIGKVKEVHTWINAAGHGRSGMLDRPENPGKPPAEVNWDQWIGPAPFREYGHDRVYHPFTWRDWQDFGSGSIGDNGCHLLDPLYTALDLTAPLSLVSGHTGMNDEVWPAQETIVYTFPGTEYTEKDRLKITWYDGGRRPRWKYKGVPSGSEILQPASLIVGTDGFLLVPHWGTPKLYPEEDFAGYELPDPGPAHHWHDWVDACLQNDTTLSDSFAYAGPLTEAVQLGNVAARFPDQELQWDSEKLAITNLSEANPYLTKNYREGWSVHEVS
ncbi:MAG: Gfo/Idh/MocA family oxidoreductase [Verrucomicrobiales bacterium]|nr:Gfo/Idh/MocA family oxidoreductase [Verrucomicrobiales bacterium]